MKNTIKGTLLLLIATVIWGSAFVAQSVGLDYLGPFTFQTARSVLAIAFLFPLSRIMAPDKKQFSANWKNKTLWKSGFWCGIALFLAAGMQQMGLMHSTAGKAGFITTLYIVLVPLLGIFLGRKVPLTCWIGVALAVAGLYLLSGAGGSAIGAGDWLLVGCAFWFAVQITLVDRCIDRVDGVCLSCVQSLVCGVLSAIVMLLTETPDLSAMINCWFPLFYAGIISMGVAYTLQILGQKELPPTPASLLMSLESVFALLTGWLILHERMAPSELLGCGLMFTAIILSQIQIKSPA